MKYTLVLCGLLLFNWLMWSGHFADPFLFVLGIASVLFCAWLSSRMRIVDAEAALLQLGLRPAYQYFPWLVKEIIVANLAVMKIILSPQLRLKRKLIDVTAEQERALGRVILANSITLTPGTVSVNMEQGNITVHALSLEDADEDLAAEMNERVCRLERRH